MSIFSDFQKDIILHCTQSFASDALDTSKIVVELPRDEKHGDLSTNAAMVLAKQVGKPPREIASMLADSLSARDDVSAVDIAGPGFINITLTAGRWGQELGPILSAKQDYGRIEAPAHASPINVEFVSANPTGPLHAAHARGAIFGDALANVLDFTGHKVVREYYINDAGAQVDTLARSAYLRYLQALGEPDITIGEGLYPGAYLIEVGEALCDEFGDQFRGQPEDVWLVPVRSFTIDRMLQSIKSDLEKLGVKMDIYSSERALVDSGMVADAISQLEQDGHVYRGVLEPPKGQLPEDWEPREQLLFKATDFGDDIDRPLQKSDGSWTYFASDVAYHMDKYRRTSGPLINVWGADHGGYVKRMQAATKALSGQDDVLDVRLCQLVSLLDKGKPVKMSKRAGTFVTLSDVMDAVGADVMRFIMLTRRNDQTLEFDYAKVTEKSRENPVFYVQYAHARACSVLTQNAGQDVTAAQAGKLTDIHELRVIKHLASWPSLVMSASKSHEPHRICFYLIELAGLFHGLWTAGRENPGLRFIVDNDEGLTSARMALVQSTAYILQSGLRLLSVTPLEEM